jgi:lipopolysaccharide export system protein LptC
MARADTHSRVVAWLKIALPLAALAVLATLFLLADRIDPDDALPYAEVDVEDRARTPRMTAPTYAGVTSDGAALTLSADQARPASDANQALALGLTLTLDTPDGARTELTAASAQIDDEARQVVLSGGVEAATSAGYRIATEGITANLDRSGLESTGPVTAATPAGTLSADRFTLRPDAKAEGAYVLVFNGAVKLVYQPGGTGSP